MDQENMFREHVFPILNNYQWWRWQWVTEQLYMFSTVAFSLYIIYSTRPVLMMWLWWETVRRVHNTFYFKSFLGVPFFFFKEKNIDDDVLIEAAAVRPKGKEHFSGSSPFIFPFNVSLFYAKLSGCWNYHKKTTWSKKGELCLYTQWAKDKRILPKPK